MTKTLQSGLNVDINKYYQLLEWKDTHFHKYLFFMQEYPHLKNSINNIHNIATFKALLMYANID